LAATLQIAAHGRCAQGDDRNALGLRRRFERFQNFIAVRSGHPDIGNDQVDIVVGGHVQRLAAIFCHHKAQVIGLGEYFGHQQAIDLVILDIKHLWYFQTHGSEIPCSPLRHGEQ